MNMRVNLHEVQESKLNHGNRRQNGGYFLGRKWLSAGSWHKGGLRQTLTIFSILTCIVFIQVYASMKPH